MTSGGDTPSVGDRFDIFDAVGPISGAFATLDLPSLPAGLEWDVQRLTVDGAISVQLAPTFGTSAVVVDGTQVYAADDGEGIWKSNDSGSSWIAASTQPTGKRVKGLVMNSTNHSILYAATYGGGVFKSIDSADNWAACANTGLSGAGLNALTIVMDQGGTLYAGTESGIFTSTDCGTWSAVNSGLTVNAATPPVTIAIDPTTPTTLYAGLDGGGVYKSSNSGGTLDAANAQPTNRRV